MHLVQIKVRGSKFGVLLIISKSIIVQMQEEKVFNRLFLKTCQTWISGNNEVFDDFHEL